MHNGPSPAVIDVDSLFLSEAPTTVPIDTARVPVIVSGDWDLSVCSVAEGSRKSGKLKFRKREQSTNPLPVLVGRYGDLVIPNKGAQFVASAKGLVPVRVIGRHPLWQKFRNELLACIKNDDGLAYAPLTHPDLRDVDAWIDQARSKAISEHILSRHRTVLDIGAHLGYMCEELEKTGRLCVAVEVNPTYYYFLTKLKRSQGFRFQTVNESIFDYVERHNKFDVVLSLAVFHHFIKTQDGHEQLIRLLKRLEMGEMFFWAHNSREPQMRMAYRNYESDEFAEFIIRYSCLRHYESIGVFNNDRSLYHLWC
jgi:Methyltransferase domain